MQTAGPLQMTQKEGKNKLHLVRQHNHQQAKPSLQGSNFTLVLVLRPAPIADRGPCYLQERSGVTRAAVWLEKQPRIFAQE